MKWYVIGSVVLIPPCMVIGFVVAAGLYLLACKFDGRVHNLTIDTYLYRLSTPPPAPPDPDDGDGEQ